MAGKQLGKKESEYSKLLEKHAIAFTIAVVAVIAGMAIFYALSLDQQIRNATAPKTS